MDSNREQQPFSSNSETDERLLLHLTISVKHSFEELLQVYELPLLTYIKRLLHGLNYPILIEIEDVFQEAMDDVYHGLKTHEGDVEWFKQLPLRRWLYIVTKKAFLKCIRKKMPATVSLYLSEDSIVDTLEDTLFEMPEVALERSELKTFVGRLIEMLEDPYRTAVRLYYLEERSQAEIAIQMNCPSSTVRSYVHRGLKKLRDIWQIEEKRG